METFAGMPVKQRVRPINITHKICSKRKRWKAFDVSDRLTELHSVVRKQVRKMTAEANLKGFGEMCLNGVHN